MFTSLILAYLPVDFSLTDKHPVALLLAFQVASSRRTTGVRGRVLRTNAG
jgi:hypothetical protein